MDELKTGNTVLLDKKNDIRQIGKYVIKVFYGHCAHEIMEALLICIRPAPD